MHRQLLVMFLCIVSVGCKTHPKLATSVAHPPQYPDVIAMPLGFAGSPTLTSDQIASLAARLSKLRFKERADLEAALPHGSRLVPVSYALISPMDASGRPRPYTETISVCRLSGDRDIVVVEENSSGVDIIQKWFIRDLSKANRLNPKGGNPEH